MAKEHCPLCDSELGTLEPNRGVEPFAKLRTCSKFACRLWPSLIAAADSFPDEWLSQDYQVDTCLL